MYFADGHCDFLYGMVNDGYDIAKPAGRQSVSLDRLKKGGVKLQLFAAWIDVKHKRPYLSQFMSMADAYERMLEQNKELVKLTPDFDVNGDAIATMLTIEGGEAIEGYEDILRCVHRMGAKAMTLTWNTQNELANPAVKKGKKGLTFLGKEIVREMGRIGMAVDVSHLNDAGIDDVLNEDVKVFASHSNARAVFDSPRALRDEHIKEIARRGGTVGVNFYHKQLTEKHFADIEDIARHAVHILEVGGGNCLAIGSDFDGMGRYPEGLADPSCLPALARALERAGVTGEALEAACWRNLMRFAKSLC
ncbi:MAG: membrane dipeptidase [Clostridia bacterium]|nr:membrane dipeptidase [Clostridia bacterium]